MTGQHAAALDRLDVSRETRARLLRFADLFDKWSRRINLVAASTRPALIDRHLRDSLQLTGLQPAARQWLDLGSGAGFPGLVIAIVLAEHGEGWVDLVESNHKKVAFLRAAIAETGARATVHAMRIEDAAGSIGLPQAVSARALAGLDALLGLAAPWLADTPAQGWFHKGRDYRQEVAKARGRWRFDLVEHPSSIDSQAAVLQISNLSKRVEL